MKNAIFHWFLNIFWHFLTRFWHFLTLFDTFWHVFWHFLTLFWFFNVFFDTEGVFDTFWHVLTLFDTELRRAFRPGHLIWLSELWRQLASFCAACRSNQLEHKVCTLCALMWAYAERERRSIHIHTYGTCIWTPSSPQEFRRLQVLFYRSHRHNLLFEILDFLPFQFCWCTRAAYSSRCKCTCL